MLGDGQLLKNDKGAYYPATPTTPTNPTNPGNPIAGSGDTVTGLPAGGKSGNPIFSDTYAENGASVTEVTEAGKTCEHGDHKSDCLCVECTT